MFVFLYIDLKLSDLVLTEEFPEIVKAIKTMDDFVSIGTSATALQHFADLRSSNLKVH